jgi:hypothetical protein
MKRRTHYPFHFAAFELVPLDVSAPQFLCCAHCGWEFTHQVDHVVHLRDREDGPGTRFQVNHEGSTAGPFREDENACAGRRDDAAILFECERCERASELIVMQQKGQTLLTVIRARGAGVRTRAG